MSELSKTGSSREAYQLLGLPPEHPLTAEIKSNPEAIIGQILTIAESVMANDAYHTIRSAHGQRYCVSKGNKHFADYRGVVDPAVEDGDIKGFTL